MDRRLELLKQHVALAAVTAPKGINRVLVMGFSEDFDFQNPEHVPIAFVLPANPFDFIRMSPVVSLAFELKKIKTYVVCIEMSAHRGEPDQKSPIITAVRKGEDLENNCQLFIVNLADGKPNFFIQHFGSDMVHDVGNPGINGIEPYCQMSPGDAFRESVRNEADKLTPEDRGEMMRKLDNLLRRTDVANTAAVITEAVGAFVPGSETKH